MKPKQLLIWVLFLGAAIAAWLISNWADQRQADLADKAGQVLSFTDPLTVVKVELTGREVPRPITLERQGKDAAWHLLAPVDYPADNLAVGRLVRTLIDARVTKRVGVDGGKDRLGPFGLEPPAFDVKLTDKQGRVNQVRLGILSPTREYLYAAPAGETKEVWCLPAQVRGAVDRTLFDLRNKDVLSFVVADVKSLKLNWPGSEALEVTREKGGAAPVWRFADGERADPDAVEDFLFQVHGLQTKDFLDTDLDLPKLGLEPPAGALALTMADGAKMGIMLGGAVTGRDEKYLRRLAGGPVLVGADQMLAPLGKLTRHALALRAVWDLDREAVRRLTVQLPNQKLVFVQTAEEPWKRLEPPQERPGQETPAELLVWDLAKLKWEKILPAGGDYGLDKPQAVLTVGLLPAEKNGAPRQLTLVLGQVDPASGLLAAQVRGKAEIYGLDAGLLKNVPGLAPAGN
ncbi:MAG: DUF4340 domain-containing protein [Deltaproteobacteria bacterium]|nr:DUF4340 domain-containing protein [Deltaproteobacteria bacterium]